MLFNKDNNGQEELKEFLGFIYASNEFANIKTDIELAEEDMIKLIGQEVYDRAQEYYNGTMDEDDLDYKLVKHIQLPVAYYAVHAFTAHTDVSHGEDGRKVIIDPNNEKIAWDWMIDRDDEAILNKAHKTTDRLIAFLEKNEEDIEEWKESDAQKTARRLFIPTAAIFDFIFPIDNSRRFFLKLIPFMDEVERKYLKPVLGERYDLIKAALESGDTEEYDDLIPMIRVPVAYLTLSIAIRRLSVTLMPNGIFQDYVSDRIYLKAKQPAPVNVRIEVAKALQYDGEFELTSLQKKISELDAEASGETYEPTDMTERMDPDESFFRL